MKNHILNLLLDFDKNVIVSKSNPYLRTLRLPFSSVISLLILSALNCQGQVTPTFVSDDGTIQSGYFSVITGTSGIYWGQAISPSPFTINSSNRNTGIAALISMNSSLAPSAISPRQCGIVSTVAGCSSSYKPNATPGLFQGITISFGSNGSSGMPNTVDISSNPVLTINYSKPLTPPTDYFVATYTDAASSAPSNSPNNLKVYQLRETTSTSFVGIPPYISGSTPGNGAVYGNIHGGLSAASPFNINNSPLRVAVNLIDINNNILALSASTAQYVSAQIGFTMPIEAGNYSQTINFNNNFVLNTNSNPCFPGNAFICQNGGLGNNGCPSVKYPIANSSNPLSPFDYTKVASIVIVPSYGCSGTLSNATSLGTCGYTVNYTCYDNTLTVTSFNLGNVPSDATLPTSFTVCTSPGNGISLTWDNPSGPTDSIVIAKSTSPTGGWYVWRYVETQYYPSNNNGFPIFDNPSQPSYYRIGSVLGGKITWSPHIAYQCEQIVFPVIPTKSYFDPPFNFNATVSTGLPISYTSSNPNVITLSGNLASIVGLGTVTITASVAGNGTYSPASSYQTVTVVQGNQTITGFQPIPNVTFTGTSTLNLNASATSGLPVTYSIKTYPSTGVAFLGTNSILILGIGTVTVTGYQSGNTYYSSASPITHVFSIVQDPNVTKLPGDVLNNGISIYPNPNNGDFTVLALGEDGSQIEILNIHGTVLRRFEVENKEQNLVGLPKGLLFVRFRNKVYKVVVE